MQSVMIDVDGCVADFALSAGIDLKKEEWSDLPKKFWKEVRETENWWLNMVVPIEGNEDVLDLMNRLKETYSVYWLTARADSSPPTLLQTQQWLKKYKFDNDPNVIVVPTPEDKIEILRILDACIFLDDKAETLEDALEITTSRVCAVEYPYNKGIDEVEYFKSYKDFLTTICEGLEEDE